MKLKIFKRAENKGSREKLLEEGKEETILSEAEIAGKVVEYATSGQNVARLNMVERGEISREAYGQEVKDYIRSTYPVDEEAVERIYGRFSRFVWSYYIIDELIDDPDISDIRLLGADRVYIKKKGVRSLAPVKFKDRKNYERFIERVALKNKINIGSQNAISKFTDSSLDDWILRFNLSTRFVISSGLPMLHIRKHSKHKKMLSDLKAEGLLDAESLALIERKILAGESFLVCGSGGSGKTTLINAMLEVIPDDRSIYCVQEAEELFSARPREFVACHTVESRGDGKVSYTLEDEAKNGLLVDTDVYIIGEIKGAEARDFLLAVHTGAICYGSVHSSSPRDAFVRLADYVKRASDYSVPEIMFMLKGLSNVLYLEKYRLREIAQVRWDDEKKDLLFDTIYRRGGGKEETPE